MSPSLLILRPEPGASRTEDKARAIGLAAVKAPLFHVRTLDWTPPPLERFDALFLTSANAPLHAGSGLGAYSGLPCYAVGESTADAAREAGLTDVRVGQADAVALLDLAAKDGVRSALHLCGRDHLQLSAPGMTIESRPVYAAEAAEALPSEAVAALRSGAVALLHSPRAARHFAALVDAAGLDRSGIAFAAISEAALAAAGSGWRLSTAAAQPRDPALLELAAKLCQIGGEDGPGPDA